MKNIAIALTFTLLLLACTQEKCIGMHAGWKVYEVGGRYLYKCTFRHQEFYSTVNLIEHPNGAYINKKLDIPKDKSRGLGRVSRNVKYYYR
jgi:hypothetical protein